MHKNEFKNLCNLQIYKFVKKVYNEVPKLNNHKTKSQTKKRRFKTMTTNELKNKIRREWYIAFSSNNWKKYNKMLEKLAKENNASSTQVLEEWALDYTLDTM